MESLTIIDRYDQKIPEETRKIMDAFSIPQRRAIIVILEEGGELSFKELLSIVKPMNPSTLTYHLKALLRAGLVENFYKKNEDKTDYSMYKLSELGTDFLNAMLTVKKPIKMKGK